MKRVLPLFCVAALAACSSFHIGPKGEGEYVDAESLVPYHETDLKATKQEGILAAQRAAVEKVAGIFISSATTVEQAQLVEDKITSKSAGFIRRSHVRKAYQKGDQWYTLLRAQVLVKDIGEIIKQTDADAFAKKTNILVASHEMTNEEISLQQGCKQAVYRALKNQPYALINGDNLSQNNVESPNAAIDKARLEGARFLVVADVHANPLEALPGITSPFKTYRARANIKVYATNNYAVVAESAQQLSGLDPLPEIAAQKAISAACESAAKQLTEDINAAIHSAATYNLRIDDVNSIDRLKQVQDILKSLREIEDYNLVKYANSNALFEVSANISTPEELAAKILRKYSVNFTVQTITPQIIVLKFI